MESLVLIIAALACPIGMGLMMWLMNRQTGGQHNQSMPGHASEADRLAALREQRRRLEQEMAEAEKIAALEAQKEALTHAGAASAETSDDGQLQPVERARN